MSNWYTRIRHWLFTACAAIAILYLTTPLVSTSVLIKIDALTVEDTMVQFERTAALELVGEYVYEVVSGNVALEECNSSGQVFFGLGEETLFWELPCELPDGQYSLHLTLRAYGLFGVPFRPYSTKANWVIGPPLEEQLQRQQRQIDELRDQQERP